MKILYRTVAEPFTLLKRSMKVEEFELPESILSTLRLNLSESSMMLPTSARTVQEWSVGMLNR